ncbi:MAG TPA: hypothetical protein PKE08_02560 [Candidatus Paceibacterota bacterium]|nr:hypothetical protein [Candidatus Paceibacterota bacterium]
MEKINQNEYKKQPNHIDQIKSLLFDNKTIILIREMISKDSILNFCYELARKFIQSEEYKNNPNSNIRQIGIPRNLLIIKMSEILQTVNPQKFEEFFDQCLEFKNVNSQPNVYPSKKENLKIGKDIFEFVEIDGSFVPLSSENVNLIRAEISKNSLVDIYYRDIKNEILLDLLKSNPGLKERDVFVDRREVIVKTLKLLKEQRPEDYLKFIQDILKLIKQ